MSSELTAEGAPIAIRIDGRTVTGTLSGNATARSLIKQLPLTLSFSDYGRQESSQGSRNPSRSTAFPPAMTQIRSSEDEKSRLAVLDAVRHFLDQSLDGIVVMVPHSETLLALAE